MRLILCFEKVDPVESAKVDPVESANAELAGGYQAAGNWEGFNAFFRNP